MAYYVTQARADAANFILYVFVFLCTVLRLVSRWYISRKFGLEDYLVILAVAFLFAWTIIIHEENVITETVYYEVIQQPEGKQDLETLDEITIYSRWARLTIFDNSAEVLALFLTKMSLLAFYRRATSIKKHTIILHCVEAFVVSVFISTCLPIFFTQWPLGCEYNFVDYLDVDCEVRANLLTVIMAASGFNILIDFIMITLPWFVIPKLQLSKANKLKLIAMYSLGVVTIIASALRIWSINVSKLQFVPKLEAQFQFNFASMVEVSTAILCVNVPGIFAAFNRFKRGKTTGYVSNSGDQSGDSNGKVTIGGGRSKRKTRPDDVEKTDGITLTHEFTVTDEERPASSSNPDATGSV